MSLIVILILVVVIWAVFQQMLFLPAPIGTIVNLLFLILFVVLILELLGVNTGMHIR